LAAITRRSKFGSGGIAQSGQATLAARLPIAPPALRIRWLESKLVIEQAEEVWVKAADIAMALSR
jgi:hypothetical protein